MPKIQRNDPCPCGSGLKYKRCCLLKEAREAAEETQDPEYLSEWQRTMEKLLALYFKPNQKKRVDVFMRDCWKPVLLPVQELGELSEMDEDVTDEVVMGCVTFFALLPAGFGIIRKALKESHRFSESELRDMRAFDSGFPGFFRLVECDAERELVHFEDIHTENIYSVHSAYLAQSGNLGFIFSGVLGMPQGAEHHSYYLLSECMLPEESRPSLKEALERELRIINDERTRHREPPVNNTTELLREKPEVFSHVYFWELYKISLPPNIVGPDGKPLDIDFEAEEDNEADSGGSGTDSEPVKLDTATAKQIAAIAHKKYYDDWADTPLPILDGKTPRQAIKNREDRKRVLQILDQMDHAAGRADLNDPMHYLSSSHIRRELGLGEGASKG